MARKSAPPHLEKLHSIRIGNLPPETTSEQLKLDFGRFGEIGDFYRPNNLAKRQPSRFTFIRYVKKDDAEQAIAEMHGQVYEDCRITVHESNQQDSFFTQDTGFITNQLFDVPKAPPVEFDASLPEEHYPMKRKQALKTLPLEQQFALRIDDLPPEISKERLDEIFSEFGEVTSIYYPLDMKSRVSKGFAFVRYGNERSALEALERMNNTNLGYGRNIEVSIPKGKTYIGQDESPYGEFATFV